MCAFVNIFKYTLTNKQLYEKCKKIRIFNKKKTKVKPINNINDTIKNVITKKMYYTRGNAKKRKINVSITKKDVQEIYKSKEENAF